MTRIPAVLAVLAAMAAVGTAAPFRGSAMNQVRDRTLNFDSLANGLYDFYYDNWKKAMKEARLAQLAASVKAQAGEQSYFPTYWYPSKKQETAHDSRFSVTWPRKVQAQNSATCHLYFSLEECSVMCQLVLPQDWCDNLYPTDSSNNDQQVNTAHAPLEGMKARLEAALRSKDQTKE